MAALIGQRLGFGPQDLRQRGQHLGEGCQLRPQHQLGRGADMMS